MILGLFGNVGKFKTALATLIALIYLQSGIPVYTNYSLDFPRYRHLIHKLSLSELLELDIERGLILVDEVYTVAESRISTSKVNRFFSYFIFQSRKMHVDIVYTSQLTSAVDLRLFNLTDTKIACYGLSSDGCMVKFELVFEHNGRVKRRRFSIDLKVFESFIWGHYDTYQSVDPLGLKDLVIDIEKFDNEKINIRIDNAIKKIVSAYPDANFKSRRVVNDALLRQNEPVSLASFVFDRLNSNLEPKKLEQRKTLFQKILGR